MYILDVGALSLSVLMPVCLSPSLSFCLSLNYRRLLAVGFLVQMFLKHEVIGGRAEREDLGFGGCLAG